MTIEAAHKYLDLMLTKSQSGFKSPEDKDLALQQAQMAEFSTKKASFVETGFIHAALAPFEAETPFTTAADGVINCPDDYLHPTGTYQVGWNNGRQQVQYSYLPVLLKDQLGDRLGSQLLAVDAANPVLYISGKRTIQVLPKASITGTLHYLSQPPVPKFNYTLSPSGRKYIYNPIGSQDLIWGDDYVNVILNGALVLLGVNLNAVGIVQFANQVVADNLGGKKA